MECFKVCDTVESSIGIYCFGDLGSLFVDIGLVVGDVSRALPHCSFFEIWCACWQDSKGGQFRDDGWTPVCTKRGEQGDV
jgi:hypothetical protein